MPFGCRVEPPVMTLNAAQVQALLDQGVEGQHVEFGHPTSPLRTPMRYATVIAAFANADGGVLVLGYDERDATVGVNDPPTVRRTIDRALSQVEPPVRAEVREHRLDDATVFTVEVEPSHQIHIANGTVALRRGDRNVPMSLADIRTAFGHSAQPERDLSDLLERLLADSASWPDRLMQAIAEHDRERDAREECARADRDRQARILNIKIAIVSGVSSLLLGAIITLLIG
jgi:predicted HTH transcriptional regulator